MVVVAGDLKGTGVVPTYKVNILARGPSMSPFSLLQSGVLYPVWCGNEDLGGTNQIFCVYV